MADEAREVETLFRSPTDTIGATFRAYAFGSNPEFSNQPLAKAKSWELGFYWKALGKASKKLMNFINPSKSGSASPIKDSLWRKTMSAIVAEGANTDAKAAFAS